jgi:hypothetical protein
MIPAKAGIHAATARKAAEWIPAFAGIMKLFLGILSFLRASVVET